MNRFAVTLGAGLALTMFIHSSGNAAAEPTPEPSPPPAPCLDECRIKAENKYFPDSYGWSDEAQWAFNHCACTSCTTELKQFGGDRYTPSQFDCSEHDDYSYPMYGDQDIESETVPEENYDAYQFAEKQPEPEKSLAAAFQNFCKAFLDSMANPPRNQPGWSYDYSFDVGGVTYYGFEVCYVPEPYSGNGASSSSSSYGN